MSGSGCQADRDTWRAVLNDSLRKHGFVRETNRPELQLVHSFECELVSGNIDWYDVSDVMLLTEANVAYVLNGRIVRGWGTIAASVRTTIATHANIDSLMAGYLAKRGADVMKVN
jgi:hypothetical protein